VGEKRWRWSANLTSYDLSWLDQLSGARDPQDTVILRKLLDDEVDAIDRHFMFSELGRCLYKHRDAFASALEEFDAVCMSHDAEMDVVRAALFRSSGASRSSTYTDRPRFGVRRRETGVTRANGLLVG
jgi:hypothetical protein